MYPIAITATLITAVLLLFSFYALLKTDVQHYIFKQPWRPRSEGRALAFAVSYLLFLASVLWLVTLLPVRN